MTTRNVMAAVSARIMRKVRLIPAGK